MPNGGQHGHGNPPDSDPSPKELGQDALDVAVGFMLIAFDKDGVAKLYSDGLTIANLPTLSEGVAFAGNEIITNVVQLQKGDGGEDPTDPGDGSMPDGSFNSTSG